MMRVRTEIEVSSRVSRLSEDAKFSKRIGRL